MTVLSTDSITGDPVCNIAGENLGKIEDIMLDVENGKVEYAVLSFGGFLGVGDKLFAVPLEKLILDKEEKRFILNVDKERLKDAPGFDKDNWPNMADPQFYSSLRKHYEIAA